MRSFPSHPPSSSSELGERLLPSMNTSTPGKDFTQSDAAGVEWQPGGPLLPKLPPPPYQENDPNVLLSNLVFLEQKVHQLRGVVRSLISESVNPTIPYRWSGGDVGGFLEPQQIVVADTASIIAQVISTAGRMLQGRTEIGLPGSARLGNKVVQQTLQEVVGVGRSASVEAGAGDGNRASWHRSGSCGSLNLETDGTDGSDQDKIKVTRTGAEEDCGNWVVKHVYSVQDLESALATGDLDLRGAAKDGEEEDAKLDSSGCYEVLEIDKEEILGPHTHFCVLCGKGFKRDANLRMHMRGHGDMYKTMEALANPSKGMKMGDLVRFRRYSCPFEGCKRNRNHKKFQPLKTVLCVKNHYKRSHCNKSYVCKRCNSKKFSVIADLKTHEKHCGEYKWQCSCGTTFSRKDKLFGHIALFQGHSPVRPIDNLKGSGLPNVVVDRRNNGSRSEPSTPKPSCGSARAASAELGRAEGRERVESVKDQQTVIAETSSSRETNNCNFNIDDIESADGLFRSSPALTGSTLSFHALLSCDFTETYGGLKFCDV